MTREELVAAEAEIERAMITISNAWYALGVVVGYEEVALKLRTRAGELYTDGRLDDQAKLYRDIADRLDVEAKTQRKEYEREAGAMQAKEGAYADLQRLVNTLVVNVPYDNNGRDSSDIG